MALWMEAGSEPKTEKELADVDAIAALKESAALELKEEGNKYVRMGKKYFTDAIDCYTRALNQNALGEAEASTTYANRAHVNLLLGNYRRALSDSEEAIMLSPTNVKAFYRAAKASMSLNMLPEGKSFCKRGLEYSPDNVDLMKLQSQIDFRITEHQKHEVDVANTLKEVKDLVSAIQDRGWKIGKTMFQELTGIKKPILDKDNILHWPVLLLYAEVMYSDVIEDFCETDMFSAHLDIAFSESSPPLLWDKDNSYTRDAIELYYEANSGASLSKKEIIRSFLQGTVASELNFGDEKIDEADLSFSNFSPAGDGGPRWVKVNERGTLNAVLKEPNYIIPGIPVFYVVSKKSPTFYKRFKSGNWSLTP